MGFFKKLFSFANEIEDEDVVETSGNGTVDTDAMWADVVSKLDVVQNRITCPKGRPYISFASKTHKKNIAYWAGYSPRGEFAWVCIETYGGEAARDAIMAIVDSAPRGHICTTAEMKQGARNKAKWALTLTTSIDKPTSELVNWYADNLLAFYKFFEAAAPFVVEEVANVEETPATATDDSDLSLNKGMTAVELKSAFKARFGATMRLYAGRSQAEDSATLGELGLTNEGEFECQANLTVGSFIERMEAEFGLKVKVYTQDDWVAVLDGLTLAAAGKVKKNATKADMEDMVAYQRDEETEKSPEISNLEAEKARAEAEEAKAKARAQAQAAEEAKARAAAEAAAAQAEAEAAKAELEALKKAQAEAEAARAELEALKKAQAEAEKAKAAAPASKNDGALSGAFTVDSSGRKICFSRGLLQFNPAKYEFRFAEKQYDIIGKDNEKIAPNYDGWIDLFGWGTSGYMGCQPTETDKDDSNYGPASGNIDGTNFDWGVYNPITNGGNKEGIWRTPTKAEWEYLTSKRPNAAKLRVRCTVCGVEGYMLMPDNFWDNRLRLSIDLTTDKYSDNTYSAEQWSQLEAIGVVFMPTLGKREEKSFVVGIWTIWLATTSVYKTSAFYGRSDGTWYTEKHKGFGVRLVKDIK
ncbi:MAG: hypothetical protein J6R13_07065 [Alistipes sp.]|nr:hypothetical protein [Alistipes sp.]